MENGICHDRRVAREFYFCAGIHIVIEAGEIALITVRKREETRMIELAAHRRFSMQAILR